MTFDDFVDAPVPKSQTVPSAQPSQPAEATSKPLSFSDFVDVSSGRQPDKDAEIIAQHPSIIPEEYRAAGRAAANSALFNLGTHAVAAYDAATSDKSYKQAFQEQKEYEHALERRNPNASMAGTATGIAGSLLVPIGPAAQLAKVPAAVVARLGGGKLLQSAAGGAGLGASFGAAGTALENPYSPTLGQDVKTGAQTGALFGAAFGPAGEYLGNKFAGKVSTPEADLLRGQGVIPSLEMVTGEAAPKGAAADVAQEMSDKAKEVLAQKRESLLTPNLSPTAGAEAIQTAERARFKPAQEAQQAPGKIEGEFTTGFAPTETRPAGMEENYPFKVVEPISLGDIVKTEIKNSRDSSQALKNVPDFLHLPSYVKSREAQKTLETMMSSDLPMTLGRAMEIKTQMNDAFNNAQGTDRAGVAVLVDGFKNGIQKALEQGLFTGDSKAALDSLKLSDAQWAAFKKDFYPRAGSEKSIWTRMMNGMADPNTGFIPDNPTPGMLQAAQATIDANIFSPRLGQNLYNRIDTVLSKSNPAAMDAFDASIRNMILTPKNDDLSRLPKQIRDYTSGSSLPVSLKAFGAGEGNLNSLAITKTDDAATQAAKKQIADLQNYAKAIDLVYARPGTNEDKKSAVASIFKQAIFPAIGASIGLPGISEALIGAALGKGVEAGLSGPASILAARAQRTAVPSPITGQGVTTGYGTIYPGLRTSPGSLLPVPDEEPKRPVRARGGRITGPMTAKQLLDSVEAAGKKDVIATKPLLNLHDTTVANALAIANQHI